MDTRASLCITAEVSSIFDERSSDCGARNRETFMALKEIFLSRLNLGARRQITALLQGERAECGIACLAMVASFYGHHTDLAKIRALSPTSARGATLASIIHIAQLIGLNARAVSVEIDGLRDVRR